MLGNFLNHVSVNHRKGLTVRLQLTGETHFMKGSTQFFRTRQDLQAELDAVRRSGRSIGFVPTMGALHQGHLSLLDKARQMTDISVVSIFLNPTQFGPDEDLDTYPRSEAEDLEKLSACGCDYVYLPQPEEIYPSGSCTDVRVNGLSDRLDGQYRPHFFYGVTTVVARLFLHVGPDVAVFGEKDYQQLQIIRQMVRDLGFNIEIIGAPTVRAPDGLAQSSRNTYLSPEQRRQATALYAALQRAACRLAIGGRVDDVLAEAIAHLRQSGFESVDYIRAVHPEHLTELPEGPLGEGQEARLLAAAWLKTTRLIDNLRCIRRA